MAKKDDFAKILALYDQYDAEVYNYWSKMDSKTSEELQKTIDKLKKEGNLISALLLQWASATMHKRRQELVFSSEVLD